MPRAIAVVLKGYPRLSETFIAQEILALERRGYELRLVSLRHPTDPTSHPIHREIQAPVSYLPEYLHEEPLRVLRAWWKVRAGAGYREARRVWLRDLRRDFTRNRVRRFGQALVLAAELPPSVDWLYAHFLHTPASVARYAHFVTAIPWSCSAHAKDIWTSPEWEKREKLSDCQWLVTCTAVNRHHLASLAYDRARVELIYHGLDFERFPPAPGRASRRDGANSADPVLILSVGRAVPKKGYDDLLAALAQLPEGLNWRFVHVGGGELLSDLRDRAKRLGLSARIAWLGALTQDAVLEQYRRADLFALACRIADGGDRDGLPNVLLEAQSQGLPCVSTRLSGIPELIDDGRTGMLVDERDITALVQALSSLITSPALRACLGQAGCRRVREDFSFEAGIDRLDSLLGGAAAPLALAKRAALPSCGAPIE